MSVFLLCLFLFFKQKTAYEMRISDWSSDVCSSDLCSRAPRGRTGDRGASWRPHHWIEAAFATPVDHRSVAIERDARRHDGGLHSLFADAIGGLVEIGRASCRERVCQ